MGKVNTPLSYAPKSIIKPQDNRLRTMDKRPKPKRKKMSDEEKQKQKLMGLAKRQLELQGKGEGSKGASDTTDVAHAEQLPSSMFFSYNKALGPPYHVLVDTNFINFSVMNKLDIIQKMMDCLYAKCFVYVTDCVIGEMEKLGRKFRVALRAAKDPRFKRLQCDHRGVYADDCLVDRVKKHRIYIVATCDRDLKRRIRKVPGVPIMYIKSRRYTIERLPDADGMAPKV
eukprot:gb/GECH01014137.1/.p1 GENE.gb/GECH01014137.1/~~gb/GECH01014137.1/.p1  ORF type:complete len:228 (+),score=57.48 gb/GECH01014137.1/:1-684(+)